MSRDDYKLTITQAIEEMKHKQGDSFYVFHLITFLNYIPSAKSFLRRLEVSLNIKGEVVSIEGLEPSPEDWNLNPARLPIPPYGRFM